MPNNSVSTPDQDDVLGSLAAAADAARQAYMAALAANPGADLSHLYAKEMEAFAIWSSAEKQALNGDADVATAQASLDAATKVIKDELTTVKNIATWVTLVDNLVATATTVSAFFA